MTGSRRTHGRRSGDAARLGDDPLWKTTRAKPIERPKYRRKNTIVEQKNGVSKLFSTFYERHKSVLSAIQNFENDFPDHEINIVSSLTMENIRETPI